jgi:predicted ATPase
MPKEMLKIEQCRISGFKSIREADISLGWLNVVIGANGAGKSNLVSYFALLKAALDAKLDGHVGRHGGPNAFLYLGAKTTGEIRAAHKVTTETGTGTLYQRLEFQAPDSLIYSRNHSGRPAGVDRSDELVVDEDPVCSIIKDAGPGEPQELIYFRLKEGIGVYHFHDTSLASPIRSAGYVDDNRTLHSDGGNLAAFLYRLRQTNRTAYQRIVGTIRLIAPFFDDFSLAPRLLDPTRILLNWKQIGTDYEFGPHQLSDGTLRAMALVTLLLQPETELPKLIVVDEPEIGLHPYAVTVVVSLLSKTSHHTQIIAATQSPQLLDECEPEEIICIERSGQESIFTRPDPDKLKEWLEDYSLGEIWQKNVIGGGPH